MFKPKAGKTRSLKITDPGQRETHKVTLTLTAENDRRLSVLAALRDSDRSALANEIFNVALAGVRAYAPGVTGQEESAA